MALTKKTEKSKLTSRKKSKRWIWLSIIILAAGLFSVYLILNHSNKTGTETINTLAVSRGSITESIDSVGTVEASPSIELTWDSNGVVKPYDLQIGDQVNKGDVLLALEDSSLPSEILQARSSLLDAQNSLEKLTSTQTDYLTALQNVNSQEAILVNTYSMRHAFYDTNTSDDRVNRIYASYNNAVREVWGLQKAYDNVKNLDKNDPERVAAYDALQAGILKRDSLLRAFNQILGTPYGHRAEGYFILYDQRAAELAEAYAAYDRSLDKSDEIASAQANVQALQNTVNQAYIIAPFSGTVTEINADAGELATAGNTALRLDDLSHLIVNVNISQMDINSVELGQKVTLSFDALPGKVFEGKVTEIGQAGSTSNNVVLFPVVISIENPDGSIKPGFTAAVSIITHQADDALLIPNQTIQYDSDGNAYVMQKSGLMNFSRVDITIGAHSDAYSQLLSGSLKENDQLAVVVAGDTTFQTGSGQALRVTRGISGGFLFGR